MHLYTLLTPSFSPSLRVEWQLELAKGTHDALQLLCEGGGAYALSPLQAELPNRSVRVTFLYQHALLAGLGYRNDGEGGFHWGFSLLTGPLFYGARYEGEPKTNALVGAVEGRAEVGYRLGPLLAGLTVGYLQTYEHPLLNPAITVLGGPYVGLFADWR